MRDFKAGKKPAKRPAMGSAPVAMNSYGQQQSLGGASNAMGHHQGDDVDGDEDDDDDE